MRLVKISFCSIFLFFTVSSCAGIGLGKSDIVVQIIDENQRPVTGANVSFSFRNYPQDDKFNRVTDNNGYAQVKKYGDQRVSILAEKKGYYYSDKVVEFDNNSAPKSNHNNIYEIVLRNKRNPVPMYAKNTAPTKIPVFDKLIGYDLQMGDWVEPHGKGIINDFIFTCKNNYKGFKNAETQCDITFNNPRDGIQEYNPPKGNTSYFQWPFEAPETGYQSHLNKWMSIHMPGDGYKSNIVDNKKYIFRVRTIVDKYGEVINAKYGKILGDISIDRNGYIKFIYYFNPDGTNNLEFDPKQNFFKFSRRERGKHRVQRP